MHFGWRNLAFIIGEWIYSFINFGKNSDSDLQDFAEDNPVVGFHAKRSGVNAYDEFYN